MVITMQAKTIPQILIVIVMTAGLLSIRPSGVSPIRRPLLRRPADIPLSLDGWRGERLEMSAHETRIIAPGGGVLDKRVYRNNDRPIWLVTVESRENWRVHHPPEICYKATGWVIVDLQVIRLGGGLAAKELVVERGSRRHRVLYWFTDGKHDTASYFGRLWFTYLTRFFRNRIPTWLLVRVSWIEKPGEDPAELRNFAWLVSESLSGDGYR